MQGLCAAARTAARAAVGREGVHNGVHGLAVGDQVLAVGHQVRVLPNLVQAMWAHETKQHFSSKHFFFLSFSEQCWDINRQF